MEHTLLSVQHLHAWYQKEKMILKDLSFALQEHEVVGLIGLNGAGKTTLLKWLSGLLDTYEVSSVLLQESTVNLKKNAFKKHRYTVFSDDQAFGYFTFEEYLSYVFDSYGKKKVDVESLVEGFHFEEYRNVLIKDLSLGNKKKVFLITAFALKPDLLLLDEPVNGLDFQSTEFLYQLISDYREFGTVLFSSHILESITLTSDRVLVLQEGQISKTFEQDEIDAVKIREVLKVDELHERV
ncbi:MAG: ABC transporter ATP-binding protein [Lachnospiraceae bacterium]|nr:ABC transporter ATP-binding protein [Lachnospiraceae bacterium]